MKAIKTVFMGTPDFAATTFKYLVSNDCRFEAVYTQSDKVSGRGQTLVPSPVKEAALELGLPVLQPRNFRNEADVAALAALQPDLVIVAAYGQILPRKVLDIPRHGCLNVHPSILPRFRGVSPVAASILAGDEFTGVSVMLLDEGTDTGPTLAQARVPIASEDTTGSLSDKLARIGAQLILEVLPAWVDGKIQPHPQNESLATYCSKFRKEDGKIDWTWTAVEIWRRVRAFNPWPGAHTIWQGKQLKILAASPVESVPGAPPGQVLDLHGKKAGFGIATGDGVLGLVTLQLQGKKAMPAGDFIRGQRGMMGGMLGNGTTPTRNPEL